MSPNFSRNNKLFLFEFTENTKRPDFLAKIKRAWSEGFTCFKFTCSIKGRRFNDQIALRPEVHVERDAFEMAYEMWLKFENAVANALKR